MNRSLATMLRPGVALGLAFGLWAAGCTSPVCGPGTKQHQATNGDIQCVPTDGTISTLDCDADAGATLVGTKCVSAISCGPNTKLMNGVCVGTGGGGTPGEPDPCPPQSAGKICVNGTVHHFVDNSLLMPSETVRVWVVDPLKFLAAPGALVSTPCPGAQNPCLAPPASTHDTYLFTDLPTPAAGLVALAVTDDAGVSPQVLQTTGTGARVVAGMSYRVDSYATPKSVVLGWGSMYDTMGAYVAKFYLDAGPPANSLIAKEMMPASGVTLFRDAAAAGNAKYFDPDLMTLGAGTSTAAIGVALLPGSGDSTIFAFSGSGNTPGTKWETHPGNTTQNVVFVDRFHPCTQDGSGNCTN
jgi:hypothetical protein